jgi:hypothetical protein
MRVSALATLLVSLFIASTPGQSQDKKFEYTRQAEFDSQGNIYVCSDEGKLIWVANMKHCSEASVAPDLHTVVCRVARDQKPEEFLQTLRLEIFFKGGQMKSIDPGVPILEWHFWDGGRQIAIHFGARTSSGAYARYDTATAQLIEKLGEATDESLLPQWAKGPGQIQDESVPMSETLSRERTKWIAKVLRQIAKIEPGMKRRDLLKVFTTEGGLSNRFQRTYVHAECPYIKVNVRFKAADNERDALKEDPDDTIESISQPYLAWSVMD